MSELKNCPFCGVKPRCKSASNWISVDDAELAEGSQYWLKDIDGNVLNSVGTYKVTIFTDNTDLKRFTDGMWNIPLKIISNIIKLEAPQG